MKPKYHSINQVFEAHCSDLVFDKKLYAIACNLQETFVSRDRQHIEFFGGPLTGVHKVRFIDSDRDKLFDMLLAADEYVIKDDLYALRDEHGKAIINQNFLVSSDVFNLSCAWIMHRFSTTQDLDEDQAEDAKIRIGMYLIYKFLTSLLSHYFQYPADQAVARAAYDSLSLKFLLKQNGNWGTTIRTLVTNLVGKDGLYYEFLKRFDNDKDIINMINDIQGRIRDMLKNITAVFYEVKSDNSKVSVSAVFQEIEGEVFLKEKTQSIGDYTKYIKRIISDENGFIKQELIDVVYNLMPTVNQRTLHQALSWSSRNYHGHHHTREIDLCIDLVMEHAIEHLSGNRTGLLKDVGNALTSLRGTYMSSRSTDIRLHRTREEVERLMKQATGVTNQNTLAALRTSWMLYIVVRAFSIKKFK